MTYPQNDQPLILHCRVLGCNRLAHDGLYCEECKSAFEQPPRFTKRPPRLSSAERARRRGFFTWLDRLGGPS